MHRYPLSLIGIATGVACLAIGAVAYWLAHPAPQFSSASDFPPPPSSRMCIGNG